MTTYTAVPTVSNGDSWSAAQQNTYLRDNMAALFPYSAAGDLAYASASNALSRLAKPSVDSVLKNTSAGTPNWLALTGLKGALHAIGGVDFAPGGQAFSGGWADITGATLNLSLSVTCTVIVLATVVGYQSSSGRVFYVRANINGTPDTSVLPFNGYDLRNEALPYLWYAGGVPSGTRTVKMQCSADTNTNYVERGRMIAAAFVE